MLEFLSDGLVVLCDSKWFKLIETAFKLLQLGSHGFNKSKLGFILETSLEANDHRQTEATYSS